MYGGMSSKCVDKTGIRCDQVQCARAFVLRLSVLATRKTVDSNIFPSNMASNGAPVYAMHGTRLNWGTAHVNASDLF